MADSTLLVHSEDGRTKKIDTVHLRSWIHKSITGHNAEVNEAELEVEINIAVDDIRLKASKNGGNVQEEALNGILMKVITRFPPGGSSQSTLG